LYVNLLDMKTTIYFNNFSLENEIRKLLFTFAQIKLNFYQKKGFLLLDSFREFRKDKIVILNKNIIRFLNRDFNWNTFD